MEAFFPIDQSFFKITFFGDNGTVNITEDVINFQVTEEIQKMTTGSITLRDPYNIYSKILKNGKIFLLTWGYKKGSIDFTPAQTSNPNEIIGNSIRTNLRGYIQSPGGAGSVSGVLTYNCNFYGAELQGNLKDTIWYRIGTKSLVIQQALLKLGITQSFIDFTQQTEQITENNAVLQNETTFKFLNRLAFEWRCVFKLGSDRLGNLVGLFVDNNKIDGEIAKGFQKIVTGGTAGSSKVFEYGVNSFYPNVLNYTWKHNIGDSSLGDGNRIEIINGRTVVTNYTVEDQTVIISKLNENKLKEYVRTHPEQKDLFSEIVKANSLKSKIGDTTVSNFFDFVESKTAPQGLGYSANLQAIGDPLLTCPMRAELKTGFPDVFQASVGGLNKFFIKKVVHNISASGYKCSIEIADIITAFGGFVA